MSDAPAIGLSTRMALRPREAAEALGVCEKTLRKWMREDALPYLRVDGVVLIPCSSLEHWMEERVGSEERIGAVADEILDGL